VARDRQLLTLEEQGVDVGNRGRVMDIVFPSGLLLNLSSEPSLNSTLKFLITNVLFIF
jgi:hypothetical protein